MIQRLKDTGSKMLGTMQRHSTRHARSTRRGSFSTRSPSTSRSGRGRPQEREREEKRQREEVRQPAAAPTTSQPSRHAGVQGRWHDVRRSSKPTSRWCAALSWTRAMRSSWPKQAKDKALVDLNGMLIAARLDEQERAEMEAERKRMAGSVPPRRPASVSWPSVSRH